MELVHQTKIIWAINSQGLNSELAQELAKKRHLGAIMITYQPLFHQNIRDFIARIDNILADDESTIPIILDVGGVWRHRVAFGLNAKKEVVVGQLVSFSKKIDQDFIPMESASWDSFKEGIQIYLGYGAVVLKVKEKDQEKITMEVLQGGIIEPGMDLHMPYDKAMLDLDFDQIDLASLAKLGVAGFILPAFNLHEIAKVKASLMNKEGDRPWILARVDDKSIYDNINNVLDVVDGIFVSRRELALSTEAATIPMVCKELSRLCSNKAKLVVISSEILSSMKQSPTPTRAEGSDIANAVLDGVDALVLAEDIALGKYSDKALVVCQNIIEDIEKHSEKPLNWQKAELATTNDLETISYHAYKTAERLKAKAIVCITRFGNTALRLSSFKGKIPIVAVTFSKKTKKRLSLIRGVYPLVLDIAPNLDEVLPTVNDHLKQEGWLSIGDKIVFVTVSLSPVSMEASNLFTVQSLY